MQHRSFACRMPHLGDGQQDLAVAPRIGCLDAATGARLPRWGQARSLPLANVSGARLGLGIAAAIVVVGSAAVPGVLAQTLPIQVAPPQTSPAQSTSTSAAPEVTTGEASLLLTHQVTEGPYYKAGLPETNNLVQTGMQGTQITITGQVLDQNGAPVAN